MFTPKQQAAATPHNRSLKSQSFFRLPLQFQAPTTISEKLCA
nr:hypothetical protein [uncultured Kingella sp.]